MQLSEERLQKLKSFAGRYNLEFQNYELLNMAFCHTSYTHEQKIERNESYERLEFLGDAVLKLAISDLLFKSFDRKTEGQLTEQRAAIVSDKTLAFLFKKMNVSDLILTGKCEKEGSIKKDSIMACVFEAILGAIYLEFNTEGFLKAKDFIINNFKEEILALNYSNPKAELQEFTQKYNHNLPEYVTMKETGPAHDKVFVIGVYYENKFIAKGEAKSKKEAEFEAAKEALVKLKEMHENV